MPFNFYLFEEVKCKKEEKCFGKCSKYCWSLSNAFFTVYCSTKVYLRYLTEAIYEERTENIDIMCLSPGFVTTKMTLYKKGFDACTPEIMARNAFRDLSQEKESNGFWAHEVSHFLLNLVYRFCPPLFYKIISKVAGDVLGEKLELIKNNKTY